MEKLILYIIIVLLTVKNISAQTDTSSIKVSDLVKAYNAATTDQEKMDYCFQIARLSYNNDSVMQFSQKAQIYAEKLGRLDIIARCYIYMGKVYFIKHDYDSAILIYEKASMLAKDVGERKVLARAFFEMGNCYIMRNNQRAALPLYKAAINTYADMDDSLHIAEVLCQVGTNCWMIGLTDAAKENFEAALEIDRNLSDNVAKARDYSCLANIYAPNFDDAIENLSWEDIDKAQKYADSIPMVLKKERRTVWVNNIYNTYYMSKAQINLLYYKKSGQENQEYLNEAEVYNNLFFQSSNGMGHYENRVLADILNAEIFLFKGQTKEAITKIEHLKGKISDIVWLKNVALVYKTAAEIYASIGDYKKAYNDYNIYVRYKHQYTAVMSKNADFRSDFRTGMEISRLKDENLREISQRDSTKKVILWILAGTLLAVLLVSFSLQRSRKNAKILSENNNRLSQQQQEILAQRNVIDQQRAAVEKANVEIYQSINYAKHIQQAALPSDEVVKNIFPDSFVYYMPKDIVSGDFYYVTQNSGYNIFVLADCTGHGVPGGFLSMLGISAIKDLLKNPEIDILPGIMLDMMREYIKSALANDAFYLESMNTSDGDESFSTADGMDMSICAIDVYNYKMRFAGAYQSAYIVRDGEIIRLKGDRMPIGRHINEKPNFTTLYFDTEPGDMIYMQSDGIESQISVTGTKFMTKRLRQFFLDNYQKPCQEQKENIAQIMDDWIFGTIQVDDLSMAGIRIS